MVHGRQAEARVMSARDAKATRDDLMRHLEEINDIENGQLNQAKEQAALQYDHAWELLIGAAGAALLISIVSGVLLSLSINRGLSRAVSLADAVARGDLDQNVKVSSNDEIKDLIDALNRMTANLRVTAEMADAIAHGDLSVEPKPLSEKDTLGLALREMTQKLRTVVSDALSAAGNVSSGSEELSAACQQLSAGANEQAASAEEVSSSMEEMAANIKQNADNAAQTEKIARQSSADAQASGDAVNRAVQAHPAARQGDPAERGRGRGDVGDLGGAVGPGRDAAGEHRVFPDRRCRPCERGRPSPGDCGARGDGKGAREAESGADARLGGKRLLSPKN